MEGYTRSNREIQKIARKEVKIIVYHGLPKTEEVRKKLKADFFKRTLSWHRRRELDYVGSLFDWKNTKKRELMRFVRRVREKGHPPGHYRLQVPSLQMYTLWKGVVV